jgi:hypothetical protein
VPHFPQNSLSGGTAVAHDGQSLNWLSSPALLIYRERLLPRLYNVTPLVGGLTNPRTLGRTLSLEPMAAVRYPPTHKENRESRSERPPEWQNETSDQPQDHENDPKDFPFHYLSL